MNKYAAEQLDILREHLMTLAREKTPGCGHMILETGLTEISWGDARALITALLEMGYDVNLSGVAAGIKIHVPKRADHFWGSLRRSGPDLPGGPSDAYVTDYPAHAEVLSKSSRVFLLKDY